MTSALLSNMGMNNLHQALQKNFGFSEFRSPQEEVIKTILEGRDSLVIMPTGKGKSLCYQLPAMLQPGSLSSYLPLLH